MKHRTALALAAILAALAGSAMGQGLSGVVGIPYNYYFGFTGDGIFITYTVTGGTLPPGLSFSNSTLSGVPTQAGNYQLTTLKTSCFPAPCFQSAETFTIPIRQACAMTSKKEDFFSLAGGSGTVQVTAPSGCFWASSSQGGGGAIPPAPFWAQIDCPSAGPCSGSSVTMGYTVSPSTYGRAASLMIGDNLFTLSQRRTMQLFDDVKPPSDFFDAINMMSQQGLTRGCSVAPALFCPGAGATRGQIAVFITRALLGDGFSASSTPYFSDVPPSHPFFRYIQKFTELGITHGCTPTEFCPELLATRGEAAVFLIRAKLGPATPADIGTFPYFQDVPATHPFFAFVQKLTELQVTHGCGNGQFCVGSPVTREQFAILLMRSVFNQQLP